VAKPDDRITLRGVDPQLFREVKAAAVRQEVSIGTLFNTILRAWLAEQETPRVG
jgi:hypothetical protein